MVEAIAMRNYPIIRASVMLLALSYSIIYLILDILYAAVDPRIKADFKNQPFFGSRMRRRRFAQKERAHA
jgi:peptide/nickel transport system permease protein